MNTLQALQLVSILKHILDLFVKVTVVLKFCEKKKNVHDCHHATSQS